MPTAPETTKFPLFRLVLSAGPVLLLLLLFSPPWVIGEGGVERWLAAAEAIDLRWLAGLLVALGWLNAIGVGLWMRSDARLARLATEAVTTMLTERAVPVSAELDQRVPVVFHEALRLPLEFETRVDIDDHVDIDAVVPINAMLPLDTVVHTKVLGIGKIQVPIKAQVPLNLQVPIKAQVHCRMEQLPIRIKEDLTLQLPPIEASIQTRLRTKVGF